LKNLFQDQFNVSPTEIRDAALTSIEGLTNSKLFSLSQELSDLKDIDSQFETSAKTQSSSRSSDSEKDIVEERLTAGTKAVEICRDIEDYGPSTEELLINCNFLSFLSTPILLEFSPL
jgi:hypothetical protein